VNENKVLSKQKWNSALSQSKENFVDIKEKVQTSVKLLASLTSLVLHTSIASSLGLNLQMTYEDSKEKEASEELLGVTPLMDMLSPLKEKN
jgi:hypothetical protein